MKIGFNIKIIKDTLDMFETSIDYLGGELLNHENRISDLESSGGNGSEQETGNQ